MKKATQQAGLMLCTEYLNQKMKLYTPSWRKSWGGLNFILTN